MSILLGLLFLLPTHAGESLQSLVRDAAYNEAQAHANPGLWQYRLDKQVDGHRMTEEQVDTVNGPVHRLLAVDGKPLNPQQREKETARIRRLRSDPALQQRAEERHLSDEKRLAELLALLPQAFLFQLESVHEDDATIAFRPNPRFHRQGYEVRVMKSLQGELVIDTREKRIAHLRGKIARDVKFGFGFLGRVDKGGVFEIGRSEVLPGVWKTGLIRIEVNGQFSFFATISKNEYETRSHFVRLPEDLTVNQAYTLLAKEP